MSINTKNHKLFKYEDNDNADLTFLNDSMDIIDGGLSPFFVATLNSTNVYKITTGLDLTVLENGFSVRIAIPSESTGAVSLIIDTIDAIAIKKVNGKPITNLKANGVYSLTYYNENFILASGGGEEDGTTITSEKVLSGVTFVGQDGEVATGNIPINGALNATLGINGTYNIPKGYTEGGKVTQSITTQAGSTTTPGTANKTIVSANKYVTGNIIVKGDANLIAENIISGKSIFGVSGSAEKRQFKNGNITSATTISFGFDAQLIVIEGTLSIKDTSINRTTTSTINNNYKQSDMVSTPASYGLSVTKEGIYLLEDSTHIVTAANLNYWVA